MKLIWQKYNKAVLNIVLIALIFFAIYFMISFLIPFFAPFFLGLFMAMVNEPIIKVFEKKFKMNRKFASLLSLVMTLSIFTVLLTFSILGIYDELVNLQANLSGQFVGLYDLINFYVDQFSQYYQSLPENISTGINQQIKNASFTIEGWISSFVTSIIETIKSLPKITIFFIVTLLSAYFISSDSGKIRRFLLYQLPDGSRSRFMGIKTDALKALAGYFKAVVILVLFTFVEASLGFVILGVDYSLVMGLAVAISEAIPIFGTSIIFIPWIVWNILTGHFQMAIGLGVIYVVGIVLRQVVEPKIVGNQIGLHPLVTLLAMYVGLELMGVIGMFIGPFSIIVLKSFQKAGVIKIWKEPKEDFFSKEKLEQMKKQKLKIR